LKKNLTFAAIFLILSGAAMAGTTFCSAAIGDSLQAIDTSPGNCEASDMIFSMFQASGGTLTGTSFNPGLTGLDLVGVSTSLPVQAPPPPVIENTDIGISPVVNAWGSGTGSETSSLEYLASLDPTFTPQPNAPYTNWALSDVSLSLVQNISGNFQAGDTLTVTESFCLGGQSGSLPGSGTVTPLTCSGAGQVLGTISIEATATSNNTFTYFDTCSFGTCSATNSNSVTLILPLAAQIYQTLSVQNLITASSATGSITLPEILNDFDQVGVNAVPEPGTFFMICSAMTAIGCLRLRRVRKRSQSRIS
jgi:hypothetical protein